MHQVQILMWRWLVRTHCKKLIIGAGVRKMMWEWLIQFGRDCGQVFHGKVCWFLDLPSAYKAVTWYDTAGQDFNVCFVGCSLHTWWAVAICCNSWNPICFLTLFGWWLRNFATYRRVLKKALYSVGMGIEFSISVLEFDGKKITYLFTQKKKDSFHACLTFDM